MNEQSNKRYLYGAAVQGIQQFIFKTNELKDIVGASELVENICTNLFKDMLGKGETYNFEEDNNAILHAAGNIKHIFMPFEKDKCAEIVKNFPRKVMEYAPGISVSQAVVAFDSKENGFEKAVEELERRLRAQRNRPMRSLDIGLMGIERSHMTGLPVRYIIGKNHLDASTYSKRFEEKEDSSGTMSSCRKQTMMNLCRKFFYGNDGNYNSVNIRKLAFDVKRMTGQNDWLAVIHADGNGLGQVVMKVGKNAEAFKSFSQNLDKATIQSASEAYQTVMEEKQLKGENFIPFRPIVVGGDDLTVICRADLALDFVRIYIDNFEKYTHKYLCDILTADGNEVFTQGSVRDRLTACAGIVYMKSSYPFYAAYELAESLCSTAKKDAKRDNAVKEGRQLPASCIMFHKIQDSFTEKWGDIVARELTTKYDDKSTFEFGPYYLHQEDCQSSRWTISELQDNARLLDSEEGNKVKSSLRKWATLWLNNKEQAVQLQKRMIYIIRESKLKVLADKIAKEYERDGKRVCPVYDILSLHSINKQVTKDSYEEDRV